MRDRPVIYAGLALFLGLVTFPFWRGMGRPGGPPHLALPRAGKQCVMPVAYMRTSHMDLLLQWRDDVVRRGDRQFQKYDKSLTKTCLEQCHGARAEFCDKCHNYAAVNVVCWECHTDVPGKPLPDGRGSVVARWSAR